MQRQLGGLTWGSTGRGHDKVGRVPARAGTDTWTSQSGGGRMRMLGGDSTGEATGLGGGQPSSQTECATP